MAPPKTPLNPHTAILRLVAIAFALAANAGAATELKALPGKPAPALEREDLNGARVDVARLRGQVVLVNFWATWCEPCIAEMPSIERLRMKLKGRPFTALAVNYGEGAEKVAAFMKKNRLSLPVLLDPAKESARAWGAGGLPMTFLVDGRGNLRFSAFGEVDWSRGEPLRIVESLLAEARRAR